MRITIATLFVAIAIAATAFAAPKLVWPDGIARDKGPQSVKFDDGREVNGPSFDALIASGKFRFETKSEETARIAAEESAALAAQEAAASWQAALDAQKAKDAALVDAALTAKSDKEWKYAVNKLLENWSKKIGELP